MSGYSVTLRYGSNTQAFTVLGILGPDDVDSIKFVVGMDGQGLDGSRPQMILGFQRVITIMFGPILDKPTRLWLQAFAWSNDQHIIYAGEDIPVILDDPTSFIDSLFAGFQDAREFTLKFVEMIPRVGLPTAWGAPSWTTWGETDITPFGDVGYTFASLP